MPLKVVVVLLILVFLIGFAVGFFGKYEVKEERELPKDLQEQLKRFKFVNKSMNITLRNYKVIGVTIGVYEVGGRTFETYVLGFEDRPDGASADLDYLDLLVEIKRSINEKRFVVRIVQLGLDTIDVYLDDKYLGSVRPSIEVEVKF
jgi:hypothetical protein